MQVEFELTDGKKSYGFIIYFQYRYLNIKEDLIDLNKIQLQLGFIMSPKQQVY